MQSLPSLIHKSIPTGGIRLSDSLATATFNIMNECSILQFSDLVLGTIREVIEVALEKRRDSLGLDLLKKQKDKIHGAPDVIGKGISVSPTRGELYENVKKTIAVLYYKTTDFG